MKDLMSTIETCVIKSAKSILIMSKWGKIPYTVSGKRHTTHVFWIWYEQVCASVFAHVSIQAFSVQVFSPSNTFAKISDSPICISLYQKCSGHRQMVWSHLKVDTLEMNFSIIHSFGLSTFNGIYYPLG